MSEAKHTPGPWKVASASACAEIEVMEIAEVSHFRVIPEAGGWPTPGTPEDDARLIAAAPDLLAVVQELEESASYWSEYDVPVGIVDRIRSAIAKATSQA